MAASLIEVLLRDATIAGVFAAQRIDAGMLLAALRSASLRARPESPRTLRRRFAAEQSPPPA